MFDNNLTSFIATIKSFDEKLAKLKLRKIEIDKEQRELLYDFICDKAIEKDLQEKIADYCISETPTYFSSVKVEVRKIVSDAELVQNEIFSIISLNFPSLLFDFSKKDIAVTEYGGSVKYTLSLIPSSVAYCEKNRTINAINNKLEHSFCDDFIGELKVKESVENTDLVETVIGFNDLQTVQRRIITVSEVGVIDEVRTTDVAYYIADATELGEVTLCGNITDIREKTTQKGKPFFIFEFSDGTGKISGLYFTRKNTIEKIKKLKVGDGIIIRGKMETYKDKPSLTIQKINTCKLPENFVMEEKKGRCVPIEYRYIVPQKIETVKEDTFFAKEVKLPKCLMENTFVAFDFETTGFEATDKITEVGAVKIEKGRITQSFVTFVNPHKRIPEEVVKKTGITDDMVANAYDFADIVGDFYKFTDGAILVGHNAIDFDSKFLKREAEPTGFVFENKILDTLLLSRELIFGLSKYSLDKVAGKFGIEFKHHRALSDAHATAEVFIELMKIKKSY